MAHLSYEFHIAPSQILNESPRMQATMMRYLRWRGIQQRKGMKGD